jgi:hypothetical protein
MTKLPSVSEALCVAESLEAQLEHGIKLDLRQLSLIVLARRVRKDNAETACRENA